MIIELLAKDTGDINFYSVLASKAGEIFGFIELLVKEAGQFLELQAKAIVVISYNNSQGGKRNTPELNCWRCQETVEGRSFYKINHHGNQHEISSCIIYSVYTGSNLQMGRGK